MHLPHRPARRALAAAVATLVLAGCGSTVQVRSTASLGGATQDGLGSTAGTVDGSGSLPGTAPTGGSVVSTPTTTGGAAAPSGTGRPVAGNGATAAPVATSGATRGPSTAGVPLSTKPVKIGVITQQGLESAAKTFGLDGVTTGDTRKQVEAVLAWIRVNGGLGGRPIQVVQYDADLGAGSNDAIMTQACTAFTQDNRVDFVVTVLSGLKVLATCLAKSGVGLLADNTNFGDATMQKFAPILGNPSELGSGRMMNLLVDDLWKRGWLKTGSKVGVLALDDNDGHATVDGPLTSALRRHGLTAAVTRYINPNGGDGGSSASGAAVLGFRAASVDRIIPVLYSPLYFMTAAESQGYRPAYAMVSAQGPGALLEGLAPAAQLKNAAGIGWQPYLDIGKGTKPGPVSPRETLCFDLMRKAEQTATSPLIKGFQVQVCDLLFYLKNLADLRPDLPKDLLTTARRALGSRHVSPATFRVDVSRRTAGMAGYRPLAFRDSCTCFEYVGPLVAAS